MKTRDDALKLDETDPLAPLRARFALNSQVIYLDGNSLGVPPAAAAIRAQEVIAHEWGEGLIRSWNTAGWSALPRRLGDKLATLIGANPGEVVVTDTISINLFKLISAALREAASRDSRRRTIVSERANFPTDLYIAQGVIDQLDRGYTLRLVDDPADLPDAIDDETALVMLTHVNYRTGYMHDMAALTDVIHRAGAFALWDLAHSAGAVPVELNDAGADFAVGCTYKYLNGGPGSPAFVWVARRHQDALAQPLSGWWGHDTPFAMQPAYRPAEGIARFLCGTQPIVSMSLVEAGLDVFLETDMHAVRRKSLALTDFFIELVQARCAGQALTLVTPRAHAQRGSQVSLEHPHGYEVMQALIARGVIGDYREPSVLRFGFTPLYTRFVDVWDAAEALRDVLTRATWREPAFAQRHTVT
ncbi:kynureninase [Trinickia caryophylli]|uniref:Kynureninase n=1 Tax=Trinickia caryophylli TaxID=28094 RepID=A0A1X7H3A3_TRICW|nr:kynureninase [Trinickia caryophylli]PMS10035.1 kynureninase [Trinickia caryophylli]TRX18391.1 kynureninase [Trinickia caryophylli]WQE10825.1 kynureninase [Trinickia caryophylli]SMF78528.1 Kynureninase [Trinickia caryophylli]GLU35465.1 kynureninase [Trinickia caryophylli]